MEEKKEEERTISGGSTDQLEGDITG